MHFFTSVTACYIPKARVLAKTLKKHNEDAVMHLVISDDLPAGFDIGKEDFDYVWNIEDIIEVENFRKWSFMHDVVELCTAVKGAAAIRIIKELELDRLVYLDPDIGVFDSLAPVSDMLDENSVLFTPHSTAPASTPRGIVDDELCALKYGVYNFGFLAVKSDADGMRFLHWWNDRLMDYCYDDIPNGMFTDQKWGDIAPGLFDFIKIVHLPEYNVATWNLSHRTVSGSQQEGWFVNGRPLRFFHFTGYDSGAHRVMLALHAKPGDPVWELSQLYERWLDEAGQKELGKLVYKYATYDNGRKIEKRHRKLFRMRSDVYDFFTDPYSAECCEWMERNTIANKDLKKLFISKYKYKLLSFIAFGKKRKKYKALYGREKFVLKQIQAFLNESNV